MKQNLFHTMICYTEYEMFENSCIGNRRVLRGDIAGGDIDESSVSVVGAGEEDEWRVLGGGVSGGDVDESPGSGVGAGKED